MRLDQQERGVRRMISKLEIFICILKSSFIHPQTIQGSKLAANISLASGLTSCMDGVCQTSLQLQLTMQLNVHDST